MTLLEIYLRYFKLWLCLTICSLNGFAQAPDSSKTAAIIEKQKVIDKIVNKIRYASYDQYQEFYKKGRFRRYIKVKGSPIPMEQEVENLEQREPEILIYKDSIGNIVYCEEGFTFEKTKWGVRAMYYFTPSGNILVYVLWGIQTLGDGGDNLYEAWLTNYYDNNKVLIHSTKKCGDQSSTCSGFDELPLTPFLTLKEFLTKKRIQP